MSLLNIKPLNNTLSKSHKQHLKIMMQCEEEIKIISAIPRKYFTTNNVKTNNRG